MLNCYLNVLLTSWLINCVFSQHDSGIVCSKNEVTWKEGIYDCVHIGQPMSFNGLTGQTIENINLRPDVTVWTSDFIYLRQNYKGGCLCSFRYLTNETFYKTSEELLSYCDDYKYFLCRNTTSYVIDVLHNTWYYMNESRCGSFPVDDQVKRVLTPGYYWKSNTTECGFDGFSTIFIRDEWKTQDILCGAYNKDAGRHFRRCNASLIQICVNYGTTLNFDLFDSSCFLGKNTETTELPLVETHPPQRTKPSTSEAASAFKTHTTFSVSHTKSSDISKPDYVTLAGFSTKLSQITTRKNQETLETHMVSISTLGHERGLAQEHGDPDTGTEAGTLAGIVVGVCLAALAGVIVLLVFIQRRYRCFCDKNTTSNSLPKTNNGTNNQPKKSKAHTLFNNIGYDTWDDNQTQNNTKQSKRNNTELSNNEMSSTNQLRTGKDKEDYYNQSNATYVNDTTETQMTESSYSFAVETENNVEKNEMSLDEYDTTISARKGVYKTENVYNKTEPANTSSDMYDSTLSQGQSFETDYIYNKLSDDIYNKLSCNTKYGQFGKTLSENEDYDSVGNTLKNQNTQQTTDSVYN